VTSKKDEFAINKNAAKMQAERELVKNWDQLVDQGHSRKSAAEKLGKTQPQMKGIRKRLREQE
jgi:hypothetical protein